MNLQRCARCKKRPAMVFITRLENGKTINEGICLACANELGIKPVNDILARMGVGEEDMEAMLSGLPDLSDDGEDGGEGKIPTLNIAEIFGMGGGEPHRADAAKAKESKGADAGKKRSAPIARTLTKGQSRGKLIILSAEIRRSRELYRFFAVGKRTTPVLSVSRASEKLQSPRSLQRELLRSGFRPLFSASKYGFST